MKQWECRAKSLNCVNQKWHIRYTMEELEKKFKIKDSESKFDMFADDNIDNFDFGETCFCQK